MSDTPSLPLGFKTKPKIRWDLLAAICGLIGLILAFWPYLSVIGISSGFLAIGFSIVAFQHKQKRLLTWIGLLSGALTVLALCIVVGLVMFF